MPGMTVNGEAVQFDLDPQTPLLWALRDAANLTGTKYGCGVGDCGACMVIVDGSALRSCLITLAEAEGRHVTTVEGLSPQRNHPVQQALVAEQAIQCGFCTPGIVMSAAALIARNPKPSRAEILEAIPNLCRCGVYPRLVEAIQRAGRAASGQEAIKAVPKPDAGADEAVRTGAGNENIGRAGAVQDGAESDDVGQEGDGQEGFGQAGVAPEPSE